ncbi:mitochondrial carrier [Exidia glandulosa HHB12029]|uniref:Mitochondrial carrier n=1 Tax=Exidia glandulosa HHB12029 TaxID=1314781 RepID=A0A166BIH0_EXIGL|nr:mitochondrial carrier [Exidia glandulosa HHB12029]
MPKSKQYPFYLGGVAAAMAASITHPLDLTKVRMQASGDPSMLHSLQSTLRTAGVGGLWDGISATLLRQMTYSLVRFAAYEDLKRRFTPTDAAAPSTSQLALAGALSGAMGGMAGNPADVILVRMQGDLARPVGQRYGYANCFDGLVKIVRDEGPKALARGWGPNVIRASLMNASQLGSYDVFKGMLLGAGMKDDVRCHSIASFAAGTVATTVCSPADVIKSRIMNASGSTNPLTAITSALATEGPRFVFRGWLPAWVRLQPTTVLTFVFLERLRAAVDTARGEP